MPTLRKVEAPPALPDPVATMSFKQAAALLRERGYTVTGDGGSMFLVARDNPPEQHLLDTAGVIRKAQAERAARIASDSAALSPAGADARHQVEAALKDLTRRGYQASVAGPNRWLVWTPGVESAQPMDGAAILTLAEQVAALTSDPFAAPDAAAARDRFAALGVALTYQERRGWFAGDVGPMSWPEVERSLDVIERDRPTPAPAPAAPAPAPAAPTLPSALLVALDRIKPNPWQPRLATDAAYVAELAADILARHDSRPSTRGLLQLPAGRFVDRKGKALELRYPDGRLVGGGGELLNAAGDLTATMAKAGAYLQLAYGHNRLAAFQHLAATDPRYAALPIAVVTFSDAEMATAAWGENQQRRDLTVYEQAKAIERYIADFQWTQEQAAQQLKLSQPTIANKLRLLRLPKAAQKQLKDGQLSERQALALLPLTELPEAAIKRAENQSWRKPSELIKQAPKLSSDEIRSYVDHVVQVGSATIDPPALMAHTFDGADGIVSARCTDCPLRIVRGAAQRCSDPVCLKRKQARWRTLRMAQAVAATGLADAGEVDYGERETFWQDPELAQGIAKAGCANLRLYQGGSSLSPAGFDDIGIICVHEAGKRCACLMRLKRAQTKEDPEQQRIAAAKKEVAAQVVAPATRALAAALAGGNVAAWRTLLQSLSHTTRQQGAEAGLAGVQELVARYLVRQALGWGGDEQPEQARDGVGKLLISCRLPLPWVAAPSIGAQIPPEGAATPSVPDEAPDADPLAPVRRQLDRLTPLLQEPELLPQRVQLLVAQLAGLEAELAALVDADGVDDESYEDLATQLGAAQRQVGERLTVASEVGA